MFTGTPLPPLPACLEDAPMSSGLLYSCEQRALAFGANRRTPVARRPVADLRREGGRVVVLPCTTRARDNDARFFELPLEQVMWLGPQPADQRNSVFERYEVVPAAALHGKIGIMAQPLRIELMQWLHSRY